MRHNFEYMKDTPDRRPVNIAGVEHTVFAIFILGVAASTTVFVHAMNGIPVPLPTGTPEPKQPPIILSANLAEGTQEQNEPPEAPRETATHESKPLRKLPSHVFLNAQFIPQAPLGVWSAPWDEACEEVSVFMAVQWAKRATPVTASEASAEILKIVAFENANFGYHNDTTLRETAKLFTRFYQYDNIELSYDISLDDIRAELASGNVILLPVAGSLLENPFFASAPPYHMVVAVGYDDTSREFIVLEPGTKRGANYRYSYDTLWNAIHDWTGSNATITTGRKGMIVVRPATAE